MTSQDPPFGEGPGEGPDPSEDELFVPDDLSGIADLLSEGAPLEPFETGAAQPPQEPSQDLVEEADVPVDPLEAARQEAAERTADLQRLQAEFLNYKRRVERDRELVKQNAVFAVLAPMLDVLDNVDRAREAGELEGGFKGVAEQLERIVTSLGLTRFGEPGDAFDPQVHEALAHQGTGDVDVPTALFIAKAGYRIGDRVVRAAQVIVVDPQEATGSE